MADHAIEFVVAGGLARAVQHLLVTVVVAIAGRTLPRNLRRGAGRRRLVAQGSRHAALPRTAAALLLVDLLAAQRRLVRVVLFLGLFGDREVDIRGNLGAHPVGAEDGCEQALDTLAVVILDLLRVVELAAGHLQVPGCLVAAEQVALLVHHRDPPRLQLRHAGGHQVHDGIHLPGVQGAPGQQLDRDRGTGLLAVAHEHRLLGNGQVHACALHRTYGRDGARQLALHGLRIARILYHPAGAESHVFLQQLESHSGAARQAGGGKLHAQFLHLAGRHQDHAAALIHPVLDPALLQGIDHLRGILFREIAVQGRQAGRLRPQHHGHAQRHAGGDPDHHGQLPEQGIVLEADGRVRVSAGGQRRAFCCFSHIAYLCGRRITTACSLRLCTHRPACCAPPPWH